MTWRHFSRRELFLSCTAAALAEHGNAKSSPPASLHSHQGASVSSSSTKLQFFSTEDATDIEAIAALIIPSDETPGAREAGVIYFIDKALSTFDRDKQETYRNGLAEVRQHMQAIAPGCSHLSQLSPEQEVRFMDILVSSEFFGVIRTHTVMGFFGNPSYGGNRDEAGWKLIGFEDRFTFQPPFGYYDAKHEKD